jgi:hypothetical protein
MSERMCYIASFDVKTYGPKQAVAVAVVRYREILDDGWIADEQVAMIEKGEHINALMRIRPSEPVGMATLGI